VATTHAEQDPDEPDEPDEPESPSSPDNGANAPTRMVPSVGMPSREWEYSTHVLTLAQVTDGKTLVQVLKDSAGEGWDLAEIVDGGEKRVLLMRRPKRGQREARRVGFAPPTQT